MKTAYIYVSNTNDRMVSMIRHSSKQFRRVMGHDKTLLWLNDTGSIGDDVIRNNVNGAVNVTGYLAAMTGTDPNVGNPLATVCFPLTIWSYARLCTLIGIPELEAYDRIVYMCTDTEVVDSRFSEVEDIDLDGNKVGACPECHVGIAGNSRQLNDKLGRVRDNVYVNTGMMVVDNTVRHSDISQSLDVLKTFVHLQDHVIKGGFGDQDIVNMFVSVKALPERYNTMVVDDCSGAYLIHYAGCPRSKEIFMEHCASDNA